MKIANSFPELAYLVMQETGTGVCLNAEEIIIAAKKMQIEPKIDSEYHPDSEDFTRVLASCLRHDAAINDISNIGKECVFVSYDRSTGGPWTLAYEPLDEESYSDYRKRIRGTGAKVSILESKTLERLNAPKAVKPSLKTFFQGEPLKIISAKEAQNNGGEDVYIFSAGVEYRNSDGQTSRSDGPAVIDWSHGKSMRFFKNGKEHRLDGAAVINEEKELDQFIIDDHFCGEMSEPETFPQFAESYRKFTGVSLSQEQRNNIKTGKYKDFSFFEEYFNEAKKLAVK